AGAVTVSGGASKVTVAWPGVASETAPALTALSPSTPTHAIRHATRHRHGGRPVIEERRTSDQPGLIQPSCAHATTRKGGYSGLPLSSRARRWSSYMSSRLRI